MAAQALWALPDKKQHTNPPRCFNIASRLQKNSIEQPLNCRVHPVAVLKILDAFVRRPEGAKRTIGTLLGCISEGSVVDITDSFPVVHKDTDDFGVMMDQEYHKHMLALRQKVSPREVVVGWFSTGDEINSASAVIHNFYFTKESQFTATAVLPGPVHLLVDTSLTQPSFLIKAFVNVRTTVAEHLLQFHEVPLTVETSKSEKAGISQLMQARRATRESLQAGGPPKPISNIDGFEGGLKELLALFRRIQEYVRAVMAGKVEGDLAVGRGLTTALCAEPVIDMEALENLCQSSLQDALMVVYLSNLTRSQIAIAERINSQFNVPSEGM
uniref:MPN domain-containing protein n=1 Tax=Noctiluca scintillans TaxID=2966 RepID=A0A7S1F769_NOCSC